MKLGVESTRSAQHRRLIETFTLKTPNGGEAVLQVIRPMTGKRTDAAGQATLISREVAKSRAFLVGCGHPGAASGEPVRFSFPVVALEESGTHELRFQIAHGGGACDGTLTIRGAEADLELERGADVFWNVARIALGDGVAPRAPVPAGITVTVPQLLRGAESLRLQSGHHALLGLDAKGSVFGWNAGPSMKPHRVADLSMTLIAVSVGGGRLAACGAAHGADAAWRVVTVDLERDTVQIVVKSSDDFPFFDAKLSIGPLLAVAWENELRIYDELSPVARVVHSSPVTPGAWLNDGLVLDTPEGPRRWRIGTAELQSAGEPLNHRHGDHALRADADGSLVVDGRTFRPTLDADRRALRALQYAHPRWLGAHHLLLCTDRLVALDVRTFETWVVLDGPDTELHALLGGNTLVVDLLASGRPRFVEVLGLPP